MGPDEWVIWTPHRLHRANKMSQTIDKEYLSIIDVAPGKISLGSSQRIALSRHWMRLWRDRIVLSSLHPLGRGV